MSVRLRTLLVPLWLAAWLGWCAPLLGAEESISREDQVKAAYLYNFTKYVEWPADRFIAGDSPIVIGVLGPAGPFRDLLQKTVMGRQAGGRAIMVQSVATADEARLVHLLFVPAAEGKAFDLLVPELGTFALLTVGESEWFKTMGGIIWFVREGDKVRFAANLEAAEARHLKISAQLLKLAVAVQRSL